VPVPGSQPRRSDSYDNLGEFLGPPSGAMASAPSKPNPPSTVRRESLVDWLRAGRPAEELVLLKASVFDRLAADLGGLAVPIHREQGLKRNELVLLRAAGAPAPSERPSPVRR